MPAETQKAMDDQAAMELAVGRAKVDQFLAFLDRMAEARAAVAAVVVADPDDIALTHSATDGLNLVISSLAWARGDRVLTTNHEHAGVLGPLQALHDRLGVEVERVDVGDGGDDERTLAAFRTALERPARAVVVSHVLWTTGAILPVGRLGTIAREAGVVTIVDGAQAAGAIPVARGPRRRRVRDPGQKWLLGPEGSGALWAAGRSRTRGAAVSGYLAYASVPSAGGGRCTRAPGGSRRRGSTGRR